MRNIISRNPITKADFIAKFINLPCAPKELAEYIYDAGIKSFDDLKKNDPEFIYSLICIRNKRNFSYDTLIDLKDIISQI
ncbi:MAG: hypothetical protein QMC67_09020 [Candidatus Wallbacteria bacterium]